MIVTNEQQHLHVSPQWFQGVRKLPNEVSLSVAGYSVNVRLVPSVLERIHLPLLAMLHQRSCERRVLAGLAGVPGGGKSTLGAVLQYLAEKIWGADMLVVLGLDGWHYPNSVLDQRTILDSDGHIVPLRSRKGGPESFDVMALAECLRQLEQPGKSVSMPVYDRRRHDPLPEALVVKSTVKIVLIEGNFLFSHQPPWDSVSSMLAPKIFLDSNLALARERVIARHVRGGCTVEQATAKYESNDRINAEIVLSTRVNADIHICEEE